MDGAHDLGGMHGFGPVDQTEAELFPNQWQEKVFGLTLACGFQGKWNLDESRYARERMDPGHYLTSSYYEHWLFGLEGLLVEKELVTAEELAGGQIANEKIYQPVVKHRVAGILQSGAPTTVKENAPPQYELGHWVFIYNKHTPKHTRVPRYIRGKKGQIVTCHGAHIFPDTHAESGEKIPAHLYTIRFAAVELWGVECAEPKTSICVDVFEPYIAGPA